MFISNIGLWKWKWSRSVVSDSLQPVDCSPPSSSAHGILQARILEWVAISFSRGSSRPRDRTQVSHIAGRHFNLCATREALLTTVKSLLCAQFRSLAKSYMTLCDRMSRSMPGLPVHHHLPEFTQTHVHRVSDAIQPSHPLSSPSSPTPNPSQHQGLFQWVNSSQEVAKVLEFQLQDHSFQRNPLVDLLQNGLVGSPCSPRDSQESSPTPQFKSINSSALRFLYSPTLISNNYRLDYMDLSRQSNVSAFEYAV